MVVTQHYFDWTTTEDDIIFVFSIDAASDAELFAASNTLIFAATDPTNTVGTVTALGATDYDEQTGTASAVQSTM